MGGNGTRTILLTGATHGLGRALVDRFAEAGHVVWGCGRSRNRVEELAAAHPNPHRFAAVDVADREAVEAWVRPLLAEHGTPDLLINNAARINRNAPLWKVPADEFDAVIDVNLKGIANLVRTVVPAMVTRGTGTIVNFSSYWGRSASAEVAPYCCTKWGVEGLTKSLAQELPKGMAAVAFNPGVVHTRMLESAFGEGAKNYGDPDAWSREAAPALLALGPRDNGTSVTAPGQ